MCQVQILRTVIVKKHVDLCILQLLSHDIFLLLAFFGPEYLHAFLLTN